MYLLVPDVAKDVIRRYISSIGKAVPVRYIDVGTGTATLLGDTHGALDVSSYAVMKKRDSSVICFLGDLVDRGKNQLFNLLYILESSLISGRIMVTRGNHETEAMNRRYGFVRELVELGVYDELYGSILDLYGNLPYAVVINRKVIGFHGGLPSGCFNLSQWEMIEMHDMVPSDSCAFEIMWNDPDPGVTGFGQNPRGPGIFTFGEDVVKKFLENNSLSMIVRGHQVKMEGYRTMWNGLLTTVFSSRYHNGKAAMMDLKFDGETRTTFELIPESEAIKGSITGKF